MVRARTHALVSGPQWATEVDKSGAGGAGLLEKKAYSASDKNVDKQHVDKLDAKLPEFDKAGEAHGAADDKVTRSYSEAG